MAGEVLSLYYEGLFDLVISQEVVEELLDVIREEFSDAYDRVLTFLAPFAPQFSRKPTPEEVTAALPYIVDLDDAPIFAAAVAARPDIVLSNDFKTFHTKKAKDFWKRQGRRRDLWQAVDTIQIGVEKEEDTARRWTVCNINILYHLDNICQG